jgi:tyrosine decarboxylase/aspartate 1-decarboxylase
MHEKGLSNEKISEKLQRIYSLNAHYSDGRILCSMCTSPLPITKIATELFSESNLGDPGLFPGSKYLEKEAISILSRLLNGSNKGSGFIVSGGTEANLLAIAAARNRAKVEKPEIVVPESAHFSFDKICSMMKIKISKAALDKSFEVDPEAVRCRINKNTVAIVGSAGSPELGVIDPINELSEIALEKGIYLHVDAAFGGLVIPFLGEFGNAVPQFDFSLAGVQSITVDPHKMGMCTIPAGGLLFRSGAFLKYIKTETPYLTEKQQFTFVGTRSGSSAAATWAVFESLGREGFKKIVQHCMHLTETLYEGIEAMGFEVLLRPTLNILAFRNANSKLLAHKLHRMGWFVSYVPRLNCIRVVLMPHLTNRNIEEFLNCLKHLNCCS